MTNEHKALVAFWGQLGLPVHLQGEVREDKNNPVEFPFVTITVSKAEWLRETPLTAFVWFHDDGSGVNAQRAEYMDKVEALIPVEGCRVDIDSGCIVFDRGADWLSIYDDPDTNTGVVGFRVSYNARIYVK